MQQNAIQHNDTHMTLSITDTQHNYAQHNDRENDIQHNDSRDNTLSTMVRIIMIHRRMAQNITTRNRMPFSVMILIRN